MTAEDRREPGVKSVHMTLDVLEAVAAESDEIGVSDLAQKLDATKATVFRHLQTLLERGYLSQNLSTQRYRLGSRSILLGQAALGRIDLSVASQDSVRALRDELGETVVLSVIESRGVTVLMTLLGKSPLEIGVRAGSALELHCSAQGKVALAFSSRPFLAQLRRRELPALTPNTITTMPALEAELQRIRRCGFATAPDEDTLGINALAAPIFDDTGEAVATTAIVGPVQRIPREPDPRQVEAVLRTAQRISWNLGFSGWLPGTREA